MIEADGTYSINERAKNQKVRSVLIAGHIAQLNMFYKIGTKIGKPFTISTQNNWAKIVWTNPSAVEYILKRLLDVLAYRSSLKSLLPKLTKLKNSLSIQCQFDNNLLKKVKKGTPYKDYLSSLNRRYKNYSLTNNVILSVIIGFCDGDGETSISIRPTHGEKSSKNIIDGGRNKNESKKPRNT